MLEWPFFEARHRDFAPALPDVPEDLPLDDRCRALVRALAENGWLEHAVGDLDVRTLCLARERLAYADALAREALALAALLAAGPTFAHGITKTQLNQEWSMSLDQAIEAEAQAQAICMQTKDFARAYHAFVAKQQPVFQGD